MRRRGFGIAETLMASTILAMILVGLYGINSTAARASETQMKRVSATALAEETIELVRYERERYWRALVGGPIPGRSADGFWNYLQSNHNGQPQSIAKLTWSTTQYASGWSSLALTPPAGFTRDLVLETDAAALTGKMSYLDPVSQTSVALTAPQAAAAARSLIKVTVTVYWTQGSQTESYVLTTYLSYWLEGLL